MKKLVNNKFSVLILGAGLSGLTAAYELKKRNVNFRILESTSRIGGRIKTFKFPNGLSSQLGAEWIGNTHTNIQNLSKELGCELIDHSIRHDFLFEDRIYKEGKWTLSLDNNIKIKAFLRKIDNLSDNKKYELDKISWYDFLVKNKLSKINMITSRIVSLVEYGIEPEKLSAYYVLKDITLEGNTETSDTYIIKGGNDLLIKKLLAKIGKDNILLNHEASEIILTKKDVEITCKNTDTFHADYAICTLPIESITNIKWNNTISYALSSRIKTIKYGKVQKTLLRFDRRFWKDESFGLLQNALPHLIYHGTKNQLGENGVLIAYTGGIDAFNFHKLSNEEKNIKVHCTLKKVFGSAIPMAKEVISQYWDKAFVVFGKEELQLRKELDSMALDRILFAGEHNGIHQGFMEGAIESGLGSATKILEKLK